MNNPALNTYRQFSVQGSTPLGLIVMLYDGAIAALRRAVSAMEAGDIPRKCNQLNRALAIIAQLEGTLNFERGGEVARTLKYLYTYTRGQVLKANIENSPELLCALIEKLSTVREAWCEADRRPSPPPSPPDGEDSPHPPSPPPKPGSWRMAA